MDRDGVRDREVQRKILNIAGIVLQLQLGVCQSGAS